ncbi:MAG TPA: flagellin [Coleofasciculaceae cyanobacterium]
MPLIINTNVSSLTAQRHLGLNTNMLSKSMEKLASGYRINRAGDDAAGLQLSENLRAQIRGSKKALDNTQDGLNVLNIADGAFQTITDNLQRARELVVQANNDTYNTSQRAAIETEITQLFKDIDRIAQAAKFNGVDLMSASAPASFILQVGANNVANVDTIDVASALGTSLAEALFATALATAIWTSTVGTLQTALSGAAPHTAASTMLSQIDVAIATVNGKRGRLGAMVNRLEGAVNNLSVSIENLSSSESRIRNVDVAEESALLTRNQILQQAASTILSQANQTPQLALQLLKGG